MAASQTVASVKLHQKKWQDEANDRPVRDTMFNRILNILKMRSMEILPKRLTEIAGELESKLYFEAVGHVSTSRGIMN
jgi:hypothetical protein